MRYANAEFAASQRFLSGVRKLSQVFPVPRFIKVRTKTEALGILNKPSIGWTVDLDRAIGIFCIDRIAANVEVQSAARKVWTVVDCKSCAACVG